MNDKDTEKLLLECDAGTKMAVASFDEIMPKVQSEKMRKTMSECKSNHLKINERIIDMLEKYGSQGKEPNPMAKAMSWMKTNVMGAMNDNDSTYASIVTDGCNMGIKSLNGYINDYPDASEEVKNIAVDLVKAEQMTLDRVKEFL